MNIKEYLGKIIHVKIDRPMGSKHPKHGFIYPVNYGYVPNTVSGDGEELDCYVLGVFEPLEEFEGKCIAIIHRLNDNDDKLVIVPNNKNYSDNEIDTLTEFQERFFKHEILRLEKWNEYHSITDNKPPRKNIVNFVENYKITGNAIDLGCGSGNDTLYLIKNNWNVLAIDGTDVENLIRNKLDDAKQERFNFQIQKFEDLCLIECNLIVSNNALPFCNKKYFHKMWNEISRNILKDGFFVGNFFGLNDEWNTPGDSRTFLNRAEVLDLFENFEILEFREVEKDRPTALGKMKHWHIFEVVARKKETT